MPQRYIKYSLIHFIPILAHIHDQLIPQLYPLGIWLIRYPNKHFYKLLNDPNCSNEPKDCMWTPDHHIHKSLLDIQFQNHGNSNGVGPPITAITEITLLRELSARIYS